MASISKRPSGNWQAQVRLNGTSISKTFTTKKDASTWAREVETSAERGHLSVDLSRLKLATLGDMLERYMREVISRKQAGRNEACMIESILRDDVKLCGTRLDRLRAEQFSEWRDNRLKRMKPASVCRYLGVVQHALDIAKRDWGMPLPVNPVREVRRPVVRNRRERRITTEERVALLDCAGRYQNPLLQPLITLALETAMRRGELLAIRWCDVDTRLSVVRLRTSKNGHARTVPLSSEALRMFDRLREDERNSNPDAHVFPMKGNAVQLAWGRIVRRAGIRDLRFHDCRHEAISNFFERGFSLPEVALISGHRDTRMLLRYTHLNAVSIAAKLAAE
ncbi:site-specific integrase [Ruegeria sp. 2012CJ41-6]|uniref:Site-specific integrase n=1 Tax=Ruegeria spongiae TaxID=2942209 RepID=A0ABT0Q6T5_9RHOB|nr:site-specific integrase [Ruegeria spongiae]MCL6285543.1 site-specific integrase [Ruegeria spongiae]